MLISLGPANASSFCKRVKYEKSSQVTATKHQDDQRQQHHLYLFIGPAHICPTKTCSTTKHPPSQPRSNPQTEKSPKVVVKPFKSIPDKRQAHLGALLLLGGRAGAVAGGLGGLEHGGVVRLVDLVGREVGRVDVGRQARLEGRADPPQAVELDAPEEGVVLDLVRAAAAEAVFRVADQAGGWW
jgi:hypothetical protein